MDFSPQQSCNLSNPPKKGFEKEKKSGKKNLLNPKKEGKMSDIFCVCATIRIGGEIQLKTLFFEDFIQIYCIFCVCMNLFYDLNTFYFIFILSNFLCQISFNLKGIQNLSEASLQF